MVLPRAATKTSSPPWARILGDRKLEPAFIALTLTPPSEADIAREIGSDVDPDAIHRARQAVARGDRRATAARADRRLPPPGRRRFRIGRTQRAPGGVR